MMLRSTILLLMTILCAGGSYAQQSTERDAATRPATHRQMVHQLLGMNGGGTAQKTTAGIPTQRVIAQSKWDHNLLSYADSVEVRYTGMRKSKYDYNDMLYAYNYPYSTTPMFTYAGVFTDMQVQYDTYVHWTINPFTMPAFTLYEFSFAEYDTNSNVTAFRELFIDSVTNDNRAYRNTFSATKKIAEGYWFNLNLGVEDSAFKQYFAYDAADRLRADSVYELHLGVWRIAAKSYYTYSSSGNLIQIDHYANVADTSFLLPLVQQSKYVNTWDASNRLTSVYTSLHSGTVLEPYVKDTFGYSGSEAYHSSWRQHQYDAIHGTWWPQYRMTKHIAAGKPDTINHDGWDSIMNMWTPISRDIARYNTEGNPDTMRNYMYNWTSYSATPDYTTVYYYETFIDTTPVTHTPVTEMHTGTMMIYPNPAHGSVTIAADGLTKGGQYLLSVYNINGQQLSRESIAGGAEMNVSTDLLAPGIYWLVLDDRRGNTCRGRFVKY